MDRYRISSKGEIELVDGYQKPSLKFTITGAKKTSDFYYKVAPLFAIFTNGGHVFDSATLELTTSKNETIVREAIPFDISNIVIGFMNNDRSIVKSMTVTMYFKPYISGFKQDSNGVCSFSTSASALSQFVGQLAMWNNGFLNGNTYAKYDYEGNRFEDYYATKNELKELKNRIAALESK